jgi:LacI family transcriptional regulator
MHSKKKPVTIRDIAKLANVSIGTVDRALHNRGRVATSVVMRIKKIIDEVGYKPNIFASRLSRSKVFHFAAVMPKQDQDDHYWECSIDGIRKAESELDQYQVRIRYYFYDRSNEREAESVYQNILDSNPDGVLIAPVLYQATKNFITRLPSHIPYVFFNTNIPELNPLTFIGQDSFQSGFVCGKLMKVAAHEAGTLAVVLTHPDDYHILTRAKGFYAFFEQDPDFKVKEYKIFDFKDSAAKIGQIESIFEENNDLRGIFVTNVSTHYIAEYMETHKIARKIFLIGYDLIEKNLGYLNKGIIDFLISQKPEKQGYEGIYALYRKTALREKYNNLIMMPIDIITKENVAYYLEPNKE